MAEALNGRICPMDQSPLLPSEDIVSCNACGTLHHTRCWRENRTCTTLNCRGTPQRVVVARDTSVDVTHFNTQLDEMRATLLRVTKKLDRVVEGEGEAASKAVAELARQLEARTLERRTEANRIYAALTEVLLRIRSLDYSVTRQRFPPEPDAARRSRPRVAPNEGSST